MAYIHTFNCFLDSMLNVLDLDLILELDTYHNLASEVHLHVYGDTTALFTPSVYSNNFIMKLYIHNYKGKSVLTLKSV